MSLHRSLRVVADTWVPVSPAVMRHVLEQVKGPRDIPDDVIATRTKAFLVPQAGAVHFATQMRRVGQTSIVLMTMSAMRVSGTALSTRGVVHLGFILDGSITLTPRGGDPVVFGPGGACVVTDWNSFDAESANGTRCLHILLSEERLRDRGVRVHLSRFALEPQRSLRAPLRALALALADPAWTPTAVSELVAERSLEDLVVGLFLEAEGHSLDSSDLRAGLRSRALAEIAASHRRAELNPAAVADALAVSLRHLQRAFADSGRSIAGEITQHRARTAALLLSAPGASFLTIEEVAKRSGFSSTFELRTAFRAHFGMLPSDYRGNLGIPVSSASDVGQIRAHSAGDPTDAVIVGM